MESNGVLLSDIRLKVLVILKTSRLVENSDVYSVSITCPAK